MFTDVASKFNVLITSTSLSSKSNFITVPSSLVSVSVPVSVYDTASLLMLLTNVISDALNDTPVTVSLNVSSREPSFKSKTAPMISGPITSS